AAVFAALAAGFFWKLLFKGLAIGGLDVLDYFYPYRAYAAQAIQHGRLPLWNPDIFGGVPFLANIQTSLFYPLSALFYLLPTTEAYSWSIFLHVFLGALFAYLYARSSLEMNLFPALLAGMVFGFGGFMGGQLGHLNQFSAAIWLPALLLCWDRACSGERVFALLGALVVTVQLLAGHTQETYLTIVTLLAYALYRTVLNWRRFGAGSLSRNVLATVVVLALGGAMAGVQVLPTTELTSWSIRSGGLSYDLVTSSSLKGSMLFQALLPPYWNRALLLQPGTSEIMGYTGILPLLLALAGLIYGRRRHATFFAALAVLSLFLALGKQNPLFPALYRMVPGFNLFRVPARWLFPCSFSAAMLCGLGAEALLHEQRRLNWRPFALLTALAAAAALLVARVQSLPPASTQATWAVFGLLALVLIFAQIVAPRDAWAGLKPAPTVPADPADRAGLKPAPTVPADPPDRAGLKPAPTVPADPPDRAGLKPAPTVPA
ncbi:MAG: YfhO family protein, partial [Chloroflexota bacterium]|nr:YfhO family protein [Chloroflexota bacterium]